MPPTTKGDELNGQAITKRYEIRDTDTGEEVTGAYVLRPGEDAYAETVMFAYAALCGVAHPANRAVAQQIDPQDPAGRELLDAIAQTIEPPVEGRGSPCESVDGASFASHADLGAGSDGSMAYAFDLWRSIGYEPVSVVMRAVTEDVSDGAAGRIDERTDRQQSRILQARRLAQEKAEAMGIDPDATVVVIERELPPLAPGDVSVFPARAKAKIQ